MAQEHGENVGTVVGANVKMVGTIKDQNDIIVHGKVEGEIVCDNDVTITETAMVKGPITANNVVVSGEVNGSIEAREKLNIEPSGRVIGSISTRDLTIQSGAQFNGKSSMLGDKGHTASTANTQKEEIKEEIKADNKPVSPKNDNKDLGETDDEFELE